jgi:hypothetical protein
MLDKFSILINLSLTELKLIFDAVVIFTKSINIIFKKTTAQNGLKKSK